MEKRTYDGSMFGHDNDIVVKKRSDGDVVVEEDGYSGFSTGFKVLESEEHNYDELSGDAIIVAGPHWREELSRGERNVAKKAVERHFSRGSVLHSDQVFKDLLGEWPPWNPDGEGF